MRITKLDGLRGIFSLMLVPFHYKSQYLPDYIYNNFFIREAYTFVDFFFVLSGFVIAYNYDSIINYKDFWSYIKKRIARLYPLLLFTSTMFLIYRLFRNFIFRYFPSIYNFTNKGEIPIQTLITEYLDALLLTNSTPILGIGLGINPPTWSISAEMISYVLFGLVSVYSIGKRKKLALLFVILFSIIFCIYKGNYFWTGNYGFIRGFISFNLGYFVLLLYRMKFKINNNLEYFIPFVLILIFYFLNSYPKESIQKNMFGLISIPIFFSISILILLKTNGLFSRVLNFGSLQFLGKVSYSVYLNHYLLVSLIPLCFFGVLKIPENTNTEIFVFIITILIVVFYSKYTYKYVELKGGRYLRKILFN